VSGVAVTGLGVAAPVGTGAADFWAGCLAAEPLLATAPTRRGAPPPPGPAVGFAEDFPAERYTDRRAVRKASELTRLAAAGAHLAVDDGALPADAALREATGVVIGTTFGSSRYYLQFHEAIQRKGLAGGNAVLFTESVYNAASGHVSRIHGLRGPSLTFAGGEEAGLSALATAFDRVRLGCPAVLAGGAEQYADLVHASLLAHGRVGLEPADLAGGGPPPFGEGAAVLLLEPTDSARARGASAYAEVAGAGRARPPGPDGEADALERAARAALAEAGLGPADLDLVVGGAGDASGLAREGEVLGRLLAGAPLAYAAPKTVLGEGFAFTSAAQAAVGVLAIAAGRVPPTRGGAPDLPPGVTAPETPEERPVRRVLVLAASPPGGAAALVLAAPAERARRV